ncbi:MAG: hypothetical protein V4598_01330 [Bdellovibrionota bacterium]
MKYFFFLFLVLPAHAKNVCFNYQFEGAVKTLSGKYILITQSDTRSERKFEFDHQDIPKLAPYAGKHAKGEFILPEENPVSGTRVLSLTKIDFGTPDPLNHEKALVKLNQIECPKI